LQAEQSFSARTCRTEKQMELDFAAAAAKLCEALLFCLFARSGRLTAARAFVGWNEKKD